MRLSLAIALGMVALSGCAHKRTARRIPAPPPPSSSASRPPAAGNTRSSASTATSKPVTPEPGYVETGKASWYGHPYHGRAAANGEIYDMEKMTAAHRTLPFDTWVRVFNLTNDKSVDVRITDRGPFIDGRIIDLSHAAAREIDMIGPGTAEVRMVVVSVPDNTPTALYAVQVGAFRVRENAERKRKEMEQLYGRARIVKREGTTTVYRVLVGAEKTEDAADSLRRKILEDSHERNGFVVRLDS